MIKQGSSSFRAAVVLTCAGSLLVTASLRASVPQAAGQPNEAAAVSSGRATFRQFCAACYGVDGKGNGPANPYLVKDAADLRQIRKRRHGIFPKADLEAVLLAASRGAAPPKMSTQMMIWGPIFLSIDENPESAHIRVDHLLKFLESIQEK